MYDAGTAFLQVAPSFRNIQAEFEREAEKLARKLDDALSRAVSNGVNNGMNNAAKSQAANSVKAQAQKAAKEYSDTFKDGVGRRVEDILKKIPEVKLKTNSSQVDVALAQIRRDIGDIPNLKIGVDLSEDELATELARVERELRGISRYGDTNEQRRTARTAIKQVQDLRQFIASEGRKVGGAFAESMKNELDAAAKSFPQIRLDLQTTQAERDVAYLRERIESLRDMKIGVNISEKDFFAELAKIRAEAERFARQDLDVELSFNANKAIKRLDAVRKAAEERYGGAFDATFKQRINAAQEALGDVGIGVNPARFNAEVGGIQERLRRLSKLDIDVDIPASKYMAELKQLETELARVVEDETIDVRIRHNAREALKEIQALFDEGKRKAADDGKKSGGAYADGFAKAIRDGLDALPDVDMKLNLTDAQKALGQVRDDLVDLSEKEIGVDIDATKARLQLAAIEARLRRLAAAEINIDVKTNLTTAAAKLRDFQDRLDKIDGRNAISSLAALAKQSDYGMSRLGFLISIGSSIGTAIVPAAAAAAVAVSGIATAAAGAVIGLGVIGLGLIGVGKAVTALDKYQKDADKSARSFSSSENRVASAAAQAGSAQRSLTRAERERRQAVDDLVKAQERARRQLEDMALSVKDNAIAQRQAKLDLAKARKELEEATKEGSKATAEEREQAQIDFDERTLQLERLGVQQKRLKEDKADADRKGVAGSDEVKAAQDRILNATEAVISAQESMASAQRSMTQAVEATGVAGGEALDNLQEAMDELSPAGQRFANFLFGIKDEVKETFQFPAEEGLLPGLEEGISRLLGFRPQLSSFIHDIGSTVGSTFVNLIGQLEHPTWRQFFSYISSTAGPSIVGMAQAASNAARGVAALVVALSPFNKRMGGGLIDMTEAFARWSEKLSSTAGFKRFLDYVEANGPVVVDVIKQIATFVGRVVVAAAPIGSVVLRVFDALLGVLNGIPIPLLTAFVGLLAVMATVLLAGAAATAIHTLAANIANVATKAAATGQAVYNAVLTQYQAIAAGAIARTGQLSLAMSVAAGASATARVGLSAMMSMLGGPWGIAVAAATVAIGLFVAANERVESQIRKTTDALGTIAGAYQSGGDEAVAALARQDSSIAETIVQMRQYGITAQDVFRASTGDIKAQEQVLSSLRGELARMQEEQKEFLKNKNISDFSVLGDSGDDLADQIKKMDLLKKQIKDLEDRYNTANRAAKDYEDTTDKLGSAHARAATASNVYGQKIGDLEQVYTLLTSKTADATQAADLFRRLTENTTKVAVSATEADEAYTRSMVDLRKALQDNGTELDLSKARNDENRISILASRDALEDALRSAREKTLADIAAKVSLEEATQANEERIAAILDEIPAAQRNSDVVKELIDRYGKLPAEVTTKIKTDGAEAVLAQLKDLKVAQYALEHNLTVPAARAALAGQLAQFESQVPAAAHATGGPIVGPGTTTSDSVLIRASNDEHMWTAAEVAAVGGHSAVYALRSMALEGSLRKLLPGFARGGPVQTWPFAVNVSQTKMPFTLEELQQRFAHPGPQGPGFLPWPSSPAAQRGDSGVWRSILALVKDSGIPFSFGNAYRPGDPLWHGSGRAIDFMGYRQDRLGQFFMDMRPRVLELIHTTDQGGYYITRGVRKTSMGDQDALHRNHLHVAMDEGGWLETGWSPPIWNGTGRPEAVLTGSQWDAVESLARGGDGAASGGHIYNFEFANSTLDAGRLRAMQDREAVLARQGRPR